MADAEEQQTEGTVAAQRAAMVPGQDALGAADMATPKANLIEANQQPGPEVQKLLDIEDGAAVEQQPQSGDVALAEQARHDVGKGKGGGAKHSVMKGKSGGKVVTTDKSGKKKEKTDKSGKKKEKKEDGAVAKQLPQAAAGPAPSPDKEARGAEVVGENSSAAGPALSPDKGARGAEAVGENSSAAGPAPPLDKEASAIAGQQGGEGLGGCGRRELCCGAGAREKNPWLSKPPHTGQARHHAQRVGCGWRRPRRAL